MDAAPRQVMALPDRDSTAVGLAASRLFDLPLVGWSPEADGLVVSYDLAAAERETLSQLHPNRARQALYAHAACWTQPPRLAPDFVTMLYQAIVPPWGARMRMQLVDDRPQVENLPPDDGPPESLAEQILASDPSSATLYADDSVENFVRFAAPLKSLAAATTSGMREMFFSGSPVPSSRFM